MKKLFALTFAVALGLFSAANAAVVGEAGPLSDTASVDGWSGITVMDGYGGIAAGESVSVVNYYASEPRADGNHSVQPLIAKLEGEAWSIWAVGPVDTPSAGGEVSIAWDSAVIPDDGNAYHPAFWQWNAGVNNEAGGLVPFGENGSGMFQQDNDGTSYVPAVGDPIAAGHASGAGGRAYQMNFQTVPEPATAVMALFGILPLFMMRRRK